MLLIENVVPRLGRPCVTRRAQFLKVQRDLRRVMLYYAVPESGKHSDTSYISVRTPQFFCKYYDHVKYKTRNT